ncbi:MAG: hypothetical protein HOB37_10485 [Rhodospirillaceae bacterium]|nr:hypothetical protein [Rhodospirillaceae bacterium]
MRRLMVLIIGGALAATASSYAQAQQNVTVADRTALALTIYGNGLALVKDRRRAELPIGINELSLSGVSPQMIADSLELGFSKPVRLLSRTLRPANLNPRSLLEAHIGKTVELIRTHPETGVEMSIAATPISVANGVIARIGTKLVTNPAGRWAFPAIPDHLRAKAALVVGLESAAAGQHDIDIRYLSGGLSWRAAYTANWDRRAGTLKLAAWAALQNSTAMHFDAARVSLVAGQVRRELVSESHPAVFSRVRGGAKQPSHPAIRLSFENPKSDTAQPLPAGTVRLYGPDSSGAQQFLGEDRVGDIPIGDDVKLNAGKAFDVRVFRHQSDFRRQDRNKFEAAYEIVLVNGGTKAETVKIVEAVPGDWRLMDSDQPHTRENNQAVWRITVPAKGKAGFTYRVAVRN